ncbi:alpha/beta fold hydrolase [Actinoallomurus sp. CA-142502]|uniref:alpha/beta fold hydrolase n=1 Tax=Actinoallomurus sp. CA-142502 TaxID=3239885 RepID=UPI003D8DD41C
MIDGKLWRETCATDERLALASGAEVSFTACGVDFVFGAGSGAPAFELRAPDAAWQRFFQRVPPPWYQSFFGMLMRVPGTEIHGDELAFAQHAHLVRRVLEIGRTLASGEPEPVAGPLPEAHATTGGYTTVRLDGVPHRVFYEESGTGPDMIFLHTAGADSRQFTYLMNDDRLRANRHMVAFDLPWHGRSAPPPGAAPGTYALTTDRYAETVVALADALGLHRPVVVGASMAGEICLELALRHPDRFGGVVACEASDKVPGRQVSWARDPRVDQTLFVPEWVDGLMAPQSPAEYRAEVWWGYSQGGHGTFAGDILFYSGDWDATDRVAGIDTGRCPVVMLTGEYDYSCTAEMSRRTAEKIPGAAFAVMPRLGHFPHAENPPLFVPHLLDALSLIDDRTERLA